MELRPLGFGEIFDRAVTLYIRNAVPFAAIVAMFVLPGAILQYFLNRGSQPEFSALIQILSHPGKGYGRHIPTIFDSPSLIAIFIVSLLVSYLLWPFALNAVAVGVAAVYRNRPISFRACYAVVFRRWLQIFGVILVDLVVALTWYAVLLIVTMAVVFAATILGKLTGLVTFWLWFGVIAVLLMVMASIPLLAILYVALTFSMYSVVLEECGVLAALSLGFTRVFSRAEFWRSLLFAVAAGATVVGGSMVFGVLGVAAAFAHLPGLQSIINGLSGVVITPFAVVLLAVYYFDVRIRREGFDLEANLERLAADAA